MAINTIFIDLFFLPKCNYTVSFWGHQADFVRLLMAFDSKGCHQARFSECRKHNWTSQLKLVCGKVWKSHILIVGTIMKVKLLKRNGSCVRTLWLKKRQVGVQIALSATNNPADCSACSVKEAVADEQVFGCVLPVKYFAMQCAAGGAASWWRTKRCHAEQLQSVAQPWPETRCDWLKGPICEHEELQLLQL